MTDSLRVLVADDEPFYFEWLVDYLSRSKIIVDFATNVEIAVEMMTRRRYRFLIVDLNIPISDAILETVITSEAVFVEYPGLYMAHFARNHGYRTRQVIVYSVHLSAAVQDYVDRLYCTYLPKGQASMLKREIESVLSYDPEQDI